MADPATSSAGTGSAATAYPTGPAYTPGPVLHAAGPLSNNAPEPAVSLDIGSNVVTTAYDLMAWPSLRPALIFDQFATVRATRQSHRGSTVQFTFIGDLPEAITPLQENVDVDSAALGSTTTDVSLLEYGSAVTTTAMLRGTSFIPVDPVAAERVGWNAGLSVDILARTELDNASQTAGSAGANLSSADLREAVSILKQNNVRPFNGGNYVAVISPVQEQMLKSEADAAGWRWVVGSSPGGGNSIYMGEVGTYEGCRIIVNNNLTDQGSGYVMGAEGLAKGFSSAPGFGPNPRVVVSPVVDKLRRFASVGWHHLVGYSIFRDEAIVRLTTSATIV